MAARTWAGARPDQRRRRSWRCSIANRASHWPMWPRCGMLTQSSTVELSADVTASALCTLHHMGRIRAAQLLSVLHVNTRDESKTVENFLDSLENSHKALAGVLKHESNQGRWSYGGQVWSGSARAPAPTRTAGRPKRRAEVDGAAGDRSPLHGYTKRARRRTLTGAIHVADK